MSGAVLAIRPRTLGDVVLVTPALRALRRGYPDAALEVVTEDRYAALLEGLPGVDRVWRLERSAAATLALAGEIAGRRYRVAVDFFGNSRTAFLTLASQAPVTAGYDLRGRGIAYRRRVPRTLSPAPGRREYAAATHVRLALAAGGIDDGLATRVAIGPAARARAAELLDGVLGRAADRTGVVGLVAAGSWSTKTWPLSHAAVLARRLTAAGRRVLLLGGPGEEEIAGRLADLAPGVAALPPCDVGVLAAVIATLGAVVGTDSGPRHLAAALGVPSYAWFGPTHPDTWSPPGAIHGAWSTDLPCRGCDRTSCPHWNCLPGLAPDVAADRVLRHLEAHGRTPADLGPAARA
ncbi:MAG TPA: glycosyltransferase family 9 protein [Candidatus Eisenbacteria bacterium]